MLTALLFPGQGSQRVGMGADLFERSAAARSVFERAEQVCDLPIARLCFEGSEERLRSTEIAQPALVATELAALAALGERIGCADPADVAERLGTRWTAGHSLGEYAAAAAAGSLSTEDALRLAAVRGRLMAAAPAGAMAAVLGLDPERIDELCAAVDGTVVVANDNAPGQIVVSGETEAVAALAEAARAAGAARVIPLNVGGAFHSPLMEAAAGRFGAEIEATTLRDPRCPLIGNVSARPLTTAEEIRGELRAQIAAPVRWRESMLWLAANGAQRALECGPGNVLAGLMRRTAPGISVVPLGTSGDVDSLAGAVVNA